MDCCNRVSVDAVVDASFVCGGPRGGVGFWYSFTVGHSGLLEVDHGST